MNQDKEKIEESNLEKKQNGMWCDFCGKRHSGNCDKEKIREEYIWIKKVDYNNLIDLAVKAERERITDEFLEMMGNKVIKR